MDLSISWVPQISELIPILFFYGFWEAQSLLLANHKTTWLAFPMTHSSNSFFLSYRRIAFISSSVYVILYP